MTDILVSSSKDSVLVTNTESVFVRFDTDNSNIIVSGPIGPSGPAGPQGLSGGSSLEETASHSIGGHRVVYYNALGSIDYADPTNIACINKILGITNNAATSGEVLNIIRSGKLEDSNWSWDVTKPIYLGAVGTLVQTEPVGAALLIIVAIPKTPTEIFVTIREPIVLA
jgi:hypothetical protein